MLMNADDRRTYPPLHEAFASFKDALLAGDIELNVTLRSRDGEPLTQIRKRCGGKLEQTDEWNWQLKGEDAAMLITTAFALSSFYKRRGLRPLSATHKHIEGEVEATLIATAYALARFYEPRYRGPMVPIGQRQLPVRHRARPTRA
jgi:hypothetical protein